MSYKMDQHQYSGKDIHRIVQKLGTQIKERKEEDGIVQFELENGGGLIYYEQAGGLTYISEPDKKFEADEKDFDTEMCRKAAEEFISESGIMDLESLELDKIEVGERAETSEGMKVMTYTVAFLKKSPDQKIEYYGVGPGIRLDINADYEICGFTSVDREAVREVEQFETIKKEEIEKKICSGDGVLIDGVSEGQKLDVSIEDTKLCLYSDPIPLKQDYMAPYYVLEGVDSNKNEVTIVVPAIEDENISYQ